MTTTDDTLAPMFTPQQYREARERLGLSHEALAPLLGYGQSARVYEAERGAKFPRASTRLLLQAYLDGYRPPSWPAPAEPQAPEVVE